MLVYILTENNHKNHFKKTKKQKPTTKKFAKIRRLK